MCVCLFVCVCVCVYERERETVSKRNPAIQPELSAAEFKARARVTGQRVMRGEEEGEAERSDRG